MPGGDACVVMQTKRIFQKDVMTSFLKCAYMRVGRGEEIVGNGALMK